MASGIGERAARLVRAKAREQGIKPCYELDNLGASRNSLYNWEAMGREPCAYILQKMALRGYDVIYILTGAKADGQPD